MSEQKPTVCIVGLGLIGASTGLCLRRAGVASQVIGHDKSPAASSSARKTGAVDRTEWNLVQACEKADLIILAIPFGEIEETLRAIGPYVRPDGVIADTSSLKAPVLRWADDILPEQVHFVGLDPIIPLPSLGPSEAVGTKAALGPDAGLLQPRPDLFQGGLICLVPSGRASPDAVKLTMDLVAILGAKPLFLDALEHDGLMAMAGQMPAVVALALLKTATEQPAWRELRKLAGPTFEAGTEAVSADATELSDQCLANRENLLRWLDVLSASLGSVRATLAQGDGPSLAALFEQAKRERDSWMRLRANGDWEELVQPEIPKQSLLQPFFGGLWPRKPRQKPKS